MFPMHLSPRRNKALAAQGVLPFFGILVIYISCHNPDFTVLYMLIVRTSDIIRTFVFKSPPVMCGALYVYSPLLVIQWRTSLGKS
jgi:hypothetical protein